MKGETVYSLEKFRESKLAFQHTDNIDLTHLRTFSKFGLYFTAFIFALLVIVIKRLSLNIFYKERK